MTVGDIQGKIIEFSIPMAIGLLFQQLYNTVDTIVVGRYVSDQALAAVGSTGSIINMLVGLCSGIATGAGVVISQAYGAHDKDKLSDSIHTTVSVGLILCVLATVSGTFIIDPMLLFMKTPEDVYPVAKEYLSIYFSGVAGLLMYNMGSGILRSVGDSVLPLLFLIFSALLNTALDLVFVLCFQMGVAGVAWATVIAQALSAVLVFLVLSLSKKDYAVRWTKLRIRKSELGRILAIGMPSGIQQAVTSFSNVFVQSYINVYGSDCMAGWTACNKIDSFILIPVQSIAMASTTFVGQNFGAKKLERARKGVRVSMTISLSVTVFLSIVTVLCRRPLMSIFSESENILYYACTFTLLICPFYFCVCFNQIYAGALRGIGVSTLPTVIMLSSFVVFRQIYLFVNQQLGGSFTLMGIAYPVGWVVCSILMTIAYSRSILKRLPEKEDPTASI